MSPKAKKAVSVTALDPIYAALCVFADEVKIASAAASMVGAQPEDQLKAPVQKLLTSISSLAPSGKPVSSVTEVRETGTGRPDLGVMVSGALVGHLELKEPRKPGDPDALTGDDAKQWKKFQLLPNLIYTNGHEWRLYRGSKTRVGNAVRLGDILEDGAEAITAAKARAFETLMRDYLSWAVITPSTPKGLADLLAPLTRLLRQDVTEAVAVHGSGIEGVLQTWQQTLFPNATPAQFADGYAQTVTYALLLARLDGADTLHVHNAVDNLENGHALLARTLSILTDNSLRRELGVSIDTIQRVIGSLDPSIFKGKHDRLWLYFYEHFLAAYDPALRSSYGVYYTPPEVIELQVRLVDEVLIKQLNKPLGLADDTVTILDPAAGTGAYPLAIIQHALNTIEGKYGSVGGFATKLASSVHAFEILVGPYAVANLRVAQAIQAGGGQLPVDGLHVYLTNTLENPYARPPAGSFVLLRELEKEHERAQRVKVEENITVVIGNPPYERHEADDRGRGGWVRLGEPGKTPLVDDFFRPVRDAGMGGYLNNLYNDYIYFWRWALWKAFESEGTRDHPLEVPRPGVVSFITASSFLRGPGFIGMRELMRSTFDEMWIIDLGGDNKGARKEPNVFAIETAVCITMGVKTGTGSSTAPAKVNYVRISGDRAQKLATLEGVQKLDDVKWRTALTGWGDPLLPGGDGPFWTWPKVIQVFPFVSNGLQFKRSWPIGETRELLQRRWETLMAAPPTGRRKLLKESRDREVNREYMDLLNPTKRLSTLASLPPATPIPTVSRYAFRSFDRHWAIIDNRVGDFLRPDLVRSHSDRQVYMSGMLTAEIGQGPAVTVSADLPDMHVFANRGGKDVIPLYLDSLAAVPNIAAGLLEYLSNKLRIEVIPEDVFAYTYAVLSSRHYVKTFYDELSIPGIRLPITKDAGLFQTAAVAGRKLLNLHTWGERFQAAGQTGPWNGKARLVRGKDISGDPRHYPENFSYDPTTQVLTVGDGQIQDVAPEVYEYTISAFPPLEHWLKYRMKDRYGKKTKPLGEMRPTAWTFDMTRELLELIWLLEHTIALEAENTSTLEAILSGECFSAADLPIAEEVEDTSEVEEEDSDQPRLL